MSFIAGWNESIKRAQTQSQGLWAKRKAWKPAPGAKAKAAAARDEFYAQCNQETLVRYKAASRALRNPYMARRMRYRAITLGACQRQQSRAASEAAKAEALAASARKKPVRVSGSWKARKDAADALQARERELCGEPPSRTRLSRSDNAFCVQRSGKAPAWEIHGFQWKPEHEGAWNPAKDGLKPYSRRRPSSPELTLPPVWVTSDGSGIPTPEAAQGIPGWAWIVGGVVAAMALGGKT